MLKPALEALDQGALAFVDVEKLHKVATLTLSLLDQVIVFCLQLVARLYLSNQLLLQLLASCKK